MYTYQLKSSKGLQVVIKAIDASVGPREIKEAKGDQRGCGVLSGY